MSYPWLSLATIEAVVPLMHKRTVSQVARSRRGFLTAYKRAGGRVRALGHDSQSGERWTDRRRNFIARHMAQIVARNEPLWLANGEPSRRHLALIAWAYSPDAKGLRAWIQTL